MNAPIKTHIVTGFLGSGKTTFLNKLLKKEAFENTAIIINEFGEISLDHILVEKSDDQVIELSNGCLCCTVRGQLAETLEQIVARKPEQIIIETTGLADPVPVIQAIIKTPSLEDALEFGSLITLFDLINTPTNIEKYEEAKKQLQLADIICTSKNDIASDVQLSTATKLISSLNPTTKIITTNDFLKDPSFIKTNFIELQDEQHYHHGHDHHHSHDINVHQSAHGDTLKAITLKHDAPIEKHKIDMFLDLLFSAHAKHIVRLKGLINISGANTPLLVHGVGGVLAQPSHIDQWHDEDRSTRIVVFVEDMEPEFIERLFSGFIGTPLIDTPDKDALTQNPLAISGFKPG
ncbi:MAG: GTP-binding protein [Nitratireductor sp.]